MFENDRLKTGIQKLDDMLGGGLPRGEFMLIGGRPGMGKTALLRRFMEANEDTKCLYLSDDRCFDQLPALAEALCRASDNDCCIVLDDLDQFKVGEKEAGSRLKALAGKFNIPVIGAVKLRRELERRINKRPVIRDFRKGSAGRDQGIEQYADVILGLYRKSYYGRDHSVEGEIKKAEIIVVKNRHGDTGTVDLPFNVRLNTWEDSQNV